MMGPEIAPARGNPASVFDFVMTSQNYRKVEHVKSGFAISSFPTVIALTIFFLHFTF